MRSGRSGAALYVQPSSSVDDVLRATLELGFLVGEPVAARQVAEQIRTDVAAVEDRIAGLPPRTTFVDSGFFVPVPERSLLGDLVRRAGGREHRRRHAVTRAVSRSTASGGATRRSTSPPRTAR